MDKLFIQSESVLYIKLNHYYISFLTIEYIYVFALTIETKMYYSTIIRNGAVIEINETTN